MSGVRLEDIRKTFGEFVALRNVSLQVNEGEFVTLLGASGSGKTTCLRTVAGFVQPDAGRVFIGDDDVTRLPPYRRDTGMVFQHYALFPHMTVAQNVSYGLKVRRLPKGEVTARTREALALVHLAQLADRYPKQLSGGQRQRVALARAVVIRPRVLLLDEPLGALDLKLREELQLEIRRVQQAVGITTISVTHDQGEALSMSDRVVVMRDGEILQVDAPVDLYRRPKSAYVARFVGRMNFLAATVCDRDDARQRYGLTWSGAGSDGRIDAVGAQAIAFESGQPCLVAFRPEDASFNDNLPNRLPARVEKVTYLGNGWLVSCVGPAGEPVHVSVPAAAAVPDPGQAVTVGWPPDRSLLMQPDDDDASSTNGGAEFVRPKEAKPADVKVLPPLPERRAG